MCFFRIMPGKWTLLCSTVPFSNLTSLSWLKLLKIILLSYNSYTIKIILLKYTIQGVPYSHRCVANTTIDFKNILSPPKETLYPLAITPHPPWPAPSPRQPFIYAPFYISTSNYVSFYNKKNLQKTCKN